MSLPLTEPGLALVPLEVRGLRDVYGAFPTGVTAVCGMVDGAPVGMAATSFTPVSIEPPLVSLCIQATSQTWPKLSGLGRLGVNVLRDDQESVCRSLAAKDGDRFAEVGWQARDDGAVFLNGSVAWLNCQPVQEIVAGDHVIALLRIVEMWHHPASAPLVFHRSRFRQLRNEPVPNPIPLWLHDRDGVEFE